MVKYRGGICGFLSFVFVLRFANGENKLYELGDAWTTGDKSVGVWLPLMDDSAPYSAAQVQSLLDSIVGPFFQRNSYGKLRLSFTIRTFTPPPGVRFKVGGYGEEECSCEDLEIHAEKLKADQKLEYDFLLVILPCEGASLASVGESGACVRQATLDGIAYVTEHELGHNLGLNHAAELNDVRTPGDLYAHEGEVRDYGDKHDRMGQESREDVQNKIWGLFNAAYTRRLRWIPNENWRDVPVAESMTTVKIFAYDQGFLPDAGKAVGLHVALNDMNAAVLSYRYHGLQSQGRLEAHAFPREDLLFGETWMMNKNLSNYTQSYIIDWPHDAAGTKLCLSENFTGGMDTGGHACQLGLSKSDGAQAIPRSCGRVTAQVLDSGTEDGKFGKLAWIQVRVARIGGSDDGKSSSWWGSSCEYPGDDGKNTSSDDDERSGSDGVAGGGGYYPCLFLFYYCIIYIII